MCFSSEEKPWDRQQAVLLGPGEPHGLSKRGPAPRPGWHLLCQWQGLDWLQPSRNEAEEDPQVWPARMRKDLHQELPLESSQENAHWGEAVRVLMGRLQLEVCKIRRVDPPLPETHRGQAVQVPHLQSTVFTERSLVAAHEKTLRLFLSRFSNQLLKSQDRYFFSLIDKVLKTSAKTIFSTDWFQPRFIQASDSFIYWFFWNSIFVLLSCFFLLE